MKIKFKELLLFLLASLSISVSPNKGSAGWSTATNVPVGTTSDILSPTKRAAVAYYDSNYYATVEAAVNSANATNAAKTVYVIPGSNPTITSSFTINSNVTLVLPYDLSNTISNSLYLALPSSSNGGGTNAYDSLYSDGTTVSDVYTRYSSYCKLTVTVVSGVTITNNGKLFIGGTQSGGGGGYVSGHIGQKSGVGGFAKMILKGTASLISNGVFVNYGYLFGDNSTGTVS